MRDGIGGQNRGLVAETERQLAEHARDELAARARLRL